MPESARIAIVDAGIGNLRSVQKAFEHLSASPIATDDPEQVLAADAVVLPGVGAFGDGMQGLRARGLDLAVRRIIDSGKPFFGICVGLQLLFDESEEMGLHRGLGVLPGRVVRFAPSLTVPHMGWNQVDQPDCEEPKSTALRRGLPQRCHPMLSGVPDGAFVYFAHSFHAVAGDDAIVVATTDYGGAFPSAVARDNVWAIQFHPEKSQAVGLTVLRNFLEHIRGRLPGD
jgi:glutamine amidotransferase